jgi:Zn-dependent peptidase ImmA (M78 family)
MENPQVDIEAIAKKLGINEIQYVSPDVISTKHPNAHAYIDVEQGVIYVSNVDNRAKQCFSIAHEIFHFLFILRNDDGSTLKAVARRGETWKKQNEGSDEAVGEDIADYFAANLLIPTERFILWEDKGDEEIARAFGVETRCIAIRREEIEHELRLMAPKNLASDARIGEQASLSPDELDLVLEGSGLNDIRRT